MAPSHQQLPQQVLLLGPTLIPGLREGSPVLRLELVGDHSQKVHLSIVLPLVLLYLDDELSTWVFRVDGVKYLAKGTLIDLSLEGKPALEEARCALRRTGVDVRLVLME